MSFKPKNSNNTQASSNPNLPKINWGELNKGVKGGSRPARVSLIVDLGDQEREPSTQDYNPNNVKHSEALTKGSWVETVNGKEVLFTPRKAVQQVAVLADLMNDVVDYGGSIGKQPYRVLLNPSFKGEVRGVDLTGCYSYDDQGNRLQDKPYTYHSQSLLTKLAKATRQLGIIDGGEDNMDVSLLCGQPFMAQIAVTESGDNTYVNYKGCAEIPMIPDDDGNEAPMKVKQLVTEARVITFDSVTEDDAKFLRGDLVKKIKQALNYQGSKMQAVIENKASTAQAEQSNAPAAPKAKEPAKAAPKAAVSGNEPPPSDDFLDDTVPF
jgi:hypothetical protein